MTTHFVWFSWLCWMLYFVLYLITNFLWIHDVCIDKNLFRLFLLVYYSIIHFCSYLSVKIYIFSNIPNFGLRIVVISKLSHYNTKNCQSICDEGLYCYKWSSIADSVRLGADFPENQQEKSMSPRNKGKKVNSNNYLSTRIDFKY